MCWQVRAAPSLASRTHVTVQARGADARMTANARPVLLLASVVVGSAGVATARTVIYMRSCFYYWGWGGRG